MSDDETTKYHEQMQAERRKLQSIQGGGEGDDPPARPKRLTLSDVVERLLARNVAEHSSVGLSRNSKGETQIEVTVRTDQAAGVLTVEEAAAKALEVYDSLRARFPMSSGYVGAAPAAAEPKGGER